MSDDEEPKSKDYERMSLTSLKRELEVQKTRTETAREDARARMAENEKKARAFPWAAVIGIVVVGTGGFFGLIYALRESFPEVAQTVLPTFVYTPPDSGPPPTRPDAAVVAVDAGAAAHHVGHHPHPSGTPPATDDLGLGDLGRGTDPIEGVGSGTP